MRVFSRRMWHWVQRWLGPIVPGALLVRGRPCQVHFPGDRGGRVHFCARGRPCRVHKWPICVPGGGSCGPKSVPGGRAGAEKCTHGGWTASRFVRTVGRGGPVVAATLRLHREARTAGRRGVVLWPRSRRRSSQSQRSAYNTKGERRSHKVVREHHCPREKPDPIEAARVHNPRPSLRPLRRRRCPAVTLGVSRETPTAPTFGAAVRRRRLCRRRGTVVWLPPRPRWPACVRSLRRAWPRMAGTWIRSLG